MTNIFTVDFFTQATVITGMVLAGVELLKRVLHLQGLACVASSFVLACALSLTKLSNDPTPWYYVFTVVLAFGQANGIFKAVKK